MHQFRSYLKFLIKSTNEHGIHSPFVFDFTTKCLYSKPKKTKNKTHDVLLKSIEYFGAKSLKIVGNPGLRDRIKKTFPEASFSVQPKDIAYFESFQSNNANDIFNGEELHNDSMVVFNRIHSTPESSQKWSRMVQMEKITVSIDLYYCGLVFIRKEQVKQHFRIRI